MTYQELCDRVLLEAQRGGEAAEQANLNTQSVIESIMPSVLQEVTLKYAGGDEDKRSLLRQTHTVTLTNGVGTLPDEVMSTCIWGSTVAVNGEPEVGPQMSYAPWNAFVQENTSPLGLYSLRDSHEMFWVDPGETYVPGTGRNSEVQVTIATVLTTPDDPDAQTGWPAEVESDVIDRGAEYLRGAKLDV